MQTIDSLIQQQITYKQTQNYSNEYINYCYLGFIVQLLIENKCDVILTEIIDIQSTDYSRMKIKQIIYDGNTYYDRNVTNQKHKPNQSEYYHEKEILEFVDIIAYNKLSYSLDVSQINNFNQRVLSLNGFEDDTFKLDKYGILVYGEKFFEMIKWLYSEKSNIVLNSSSIRHETQSIAKYYGLDMKFYE